MTTIALAAPAPRNPRQVVERLLAEVARDFPLRYTERPADAVERLLAEVTAEYPVKMETVR